MNYKRILTAGCLSVGFFLAFLGFWHFTTHKKAHEVEAVELTPEQVELLDEAGMSAADKDYYSSEGLTFDQINQIATLGLPRESIKMAGGLEAFGFTTGGAAEEAQTGFPHPSLVWKEAVYQLSDPFYDKGPNDKGTEHS